MTDIEFDWDPAKAASNKTKHGISFEDAMTVFLDPLALTLFDEDGSTHEERWITMGQARIDGLMVIVHTHVEISQDRVYIRIISARKPTKNEKRSYSEGLGP